MLLKEVSEFLGVSERTVRNYASKGKLNVSYVPGKTSNVAQFEKSEVESLKAELGTLQSVKTERVNVEASRVGQEKTESGRAIVPASSFHSSAFQPNTEGDRTIVLQASDFPAMVQALGSIVSLKDKPLLTFAEAAQLSGVSEKLLRDAAKAAELKARKIGRSQRIRQTDLQQWIDSQFND